ncbi:MAG: aminotransferase class I/II-fold pyridoxal phosphate-dependent enzyme, partial [Candidatus Omnitrophica bacterium]|nr:aminotransferase class I/II-fold pyridoxal phosphate-dependent enzyme [Candidatus Omnitrophota bacterium]
PHCDMDALEKMLKEDACLGKRAIITDTVFSMDGDIAPLHNIVDLAKKYDCIVIVDEAHGFGVFGENGKGVVEHFGLEDDIDIQMGTLSKAAGCFGAYVCGSQKLIDFLINKARSFIYTTGMPPMMAAAGKRAVEIIKSEAQTRKALWENTNYMRASLKMTGFNTLKSTTPIIPIVIGNNEKTVEFSKQLYDKQILISAIRPPTVPENTARLRMTMMVSHTKKEIDWVLDNLQRIGKELCLI